MVYKCRLSFHTSHTTPAATAIPPRVQSRRCRGFNPRRSWVSVSVSVCVLSPLVVCNSVLAASRLLDSPDSSLCSSIVCPVVCVCRPASVLRRVWVVSRLRRPRDGIGRFVRVVLPHGGRYLLVARQLGCRFGIGLFVPIADRFQTFGVARFCFLPVIGSMFEVTCRRAPDRRILCACATREKQGSQQREGKEKFCRRLFPVLKHSYSVVLPAPPKGARCSA